MKKVAILVYEGCWALGVFSVADFFRVVALLERRLGLAQSHEVELLSLDGAEVRAAGGHLLRPDGAVGGAEHALLVIPGIEGVRLGESFAPPEALIAWLRGSHQAGARLLALTTGSAWLAAAGLAADQPLATHWAYARQLGRRYPDCRFVTQPALVRAGALWTTATLNASFDALLEMLAEVRGDAFAQLCATHLLVSDPHHLAPILPGRRHHADAAILQAQDWIEAHHAEHLSLARIAVEAALSERTLKRRFQQATGLSPIVYLQQVRIDRAKRLLLATALPVKAIAYEVGYENLSFFVRLFRKETGQTPGAWRSSTALANSGPD